MIEKCPGIREDVLRDRRYPVHKIADRLIPYLRVLAEEFRPEQIILFGSYVYGQPDAGSDVDLIVIKELQTNSIQEATAIRRAWRPLRWTLGSLPFDLMVVDQEKHSYRLRHAAGFLRSGGDPRVACFMITREDNPRDWFALAKDRLQGADTLRHASGITYLGVEALHEAVERYLKGYLVGRGWVLERTHNLSHLLDQAVAFDPAFKCYAGLTESLTDQFWANTIPAVISTGSARITTNCVVKPENWWS